MAFKTKPVDEGTPEPNNTVARLSETREGFIERLRKELADQRASGTNAMYDKVMAASTAEEIFEAGESELPSSRDYLGKPLEVLGYRWNLSAIEDGELPVYQVVEAIDLETGDVVNFGSSANVALRQLIRFAENGLLPFRMALYQKGRSIKWRPLNATEIKAYGR